MRESFNKLTLLGRQSGISMNRAEFMRQLESLLQSIPAAEREEALQYYNDYFDDAGNESEQEVIEALGNPARVAENIKRDLLESGYGEAPIKKALASERKLIEYGEAEKQQAAASSQELPAADRSAEEAGNVSGMGTGMTGGIGSTAGTGMTGGIGSMAGTGAASGIGNAAGIGTASVSGSMAGTGTASVSGSTAGTGAASGIGNAAGTGAASGIGSTAGTGMTGGIGSAAGNTGGMGTAAGYGTAAAGNVGYANTGSVVPVKTVQPGQTGKSGMSGWAVVLIVILVVFASPILLGLGGALFGVLASWFAAIICFGAVTLMLFILSVILLVVGIMCMFVDPVSGIAMAGGGMLVGGIGILFLMLTVAMAGIVTPAVFKAIASLLGRRSIHKKG